MTHLFVKPSQLKGSFSIPPSKSQTLRAILFGLMGKGKTRVDNFLRSTDTQAMIGAVQKLGGRVEVFESRLEIEGVARKLAPATDVIDAQNSGLVLRLVGALSAFLPTYTVITGDLSIRERRPILPLLEGLAQLGAFARTTRGGPFAPILIRGPLMPGRAEISGEDSQPVSALLIAASFLEGKSEIVVTNPGETPWVDLTLSWLDRLGIRYARNAHHHYTLFGGASYEGFSYSVPADFSTASYPIAAALVTGSSLVLKNLDFCDPQGDKQVIEILQRMGASIELDEKRVVVKKSRLQGARIDINPIIDALPLFAVLGCFAETPTEIFGGKASRHKESDRITAIATELRKMGAVIEEREDGLVIFPAKLSAAHLFSHHDHRIALSLAVAALGANGESRIEEAGCIAKTYPTFRADFAEIGASIR